MGELKPKQDDAMAGETKNAGNIAQPSKETKPHGDKLKGAFENSAKPENEKPH